MVINVHFIFNANGTVNYTVNFFDMYLKRRIAT